MNTSGNAARGKRGHPSGETPNEVLGMLMAFGQRLMSVEQVVTEMHDILRRQVVQKEWYSTPEVAEAMGVSQYTVQARWCHAGRIKCEKDPATGRWRIPGREVQRLLRGGAVGPKKTK
jgi:hypothetical protein